MQEGVFIDYQSRLQSTFSVSVSHFKQKKYSRPHWHNYYELLFYRSGTATLFCNDAKIRVCAGDLAVMNYGEVHAMESEQGTEYYCITIHPEFFSDIPFDNIHIQKHIQNDDTVKLLIHRLYEEHCTDAPWCDMMLKSHVYALMTHLLRNYTVTHISEKESRLLAEKAQRMDKVLDYIDKYHTEKLSTRELAALCHLNESYFCRCFKKTTGKSVLTYINDYRIEKAAELLESGDESIAAVAATVGFDDITYFGRCFKKLKGRSPLQYRRQK